MVDYVFNPVIDKFMKNCHLYVDPRDEEIRAKYDYYGCDENDLHDDYDCNNENECDDDE